MDATVLSSHILHLVGRHLTLELATFARELQRRAIVYCFESTEEMLDGWRLARRSGVANSFTPTAVVWLQARAGEFAQHEIDAVQALDPLARSIVVAGCWSEGEPRSGRPLAGVMRFYWHQGWNALLPVIGPEAAQPQTLPPVWIAIHAAQLIDYQGIAGVCHSLGQRTIWQNDRGPAISSEPSVRLFAGWSAWEVWKEQRCDSSSSNTPGILLLNFPRPADQLKAQREHVAQVLAQPFSAAELRQSIAAVIAVPRSWQLPCKAHMPHIRQERIATARRLSA